MINTKPITGYKIFWHDWSSLNCKKQYSCPGEFYEDGEVDFGFHGMHFCTDITDCFYYLPVSIGALKHNYYVFAEVVAPDGAEENNTLCCTNHLCITYEIPLDSVIELVNPEYFRNMDKFTHYNVWIPSLDKYFDDLYRYFMENQKLEIDFYD